jgi:LPS export ABC transporter protein LptC
MKLANNLFKNISDFLKNVSKKNIIILSMLLVSILWINHSLSNALNYNDLDLDPKATNHFINEFKMVETNADGNITWTMQGDRLEKFPNSLRSEVINPIMNINSTETDTWIIKAKHALDPDSLFNSVYLTEDVEFNKYDENNNNEVNIITTEAVVYPDTEIIETTQFATIITPNSKTTGNGLIADMKNGQIKILSNAKRLSYTDKQSQQLEGDRMLYDLAKKTWILLKKENQGDKIKIQERTKTILKTRK